MDHRRRTDLLVLAGLMALLMGYFSRILFTGRIIRAPDIVAEAYWWIRDIAHAPLAEIFRINLVADWNPYINAGFSNMGGSVSMQFLIPQKLIFWLFPDPANIAWFIVIHLFLGGAGTYCFCRLLGCGRAGAFLAGLIFAVAPENASLINAGHVMKIATISYAPWAFYCLERGVRTRRPFWFLVTALVLAFQFFNTHWQIAFYTCLAMAVYGVVRSLLELKDEQGLRGPLLRRLLLGNVLLLVFFLSTVSISLLPLGSWSVDTNRGVASGANQGKGGMTYGEAMSWSLPPEEVVTFLIPGFFGLSRPEGDEGPPVRGSHYWGRMVFTQTSDYLGLLPWLLLPLPLIFRRDRHTWLALGGAVAVLLFSFGGYTPFYRALYEWFPGINHFRVPKMMMFLLVFFLAVLTARGVDCLGDEEVRRSAAFRRYLWCMALLPLLPLALLAAEVVLAGRLMEMLSPIIGQPSRNQQGGELVLQRWRNLLTETGTATLVSSLYGASIFLLGRWRLTVGTMVSVLTLLYLADTWRINDTFLVTTEPPSRVTAARSPVMAYLASRGELYRTIPLHGTDPMAYATAKIPVLYTANAVQQQRWQEFIDAFSFSSSMPDMVNLGYLVQGTEAYERDREAYGDRYRPVFHSPDGKEVVLENCSVLPKAWLVPQVRRVDDPRERLAALAAPGFNPGELALVESEPPFPLPGAAQPPGRVALESYEERRIVVSATTTAPALLVLGEKYFRGWRATVDGRPEPIHPVNHVLRGVYLTPGSHRVEFVFDPLPFRVGKWATLCSLLLMTGIVLREWRRKRGGGEP